MTRRACLNCAVDDCFDCAENMRREDEYAGCCCGRIPAIYPIDYYDLSLDEDDESEWA